MNKKINIIYYSGTGGTERVANTFEASFIRMGYEVNIRPLVDNPRFNLEEDVSLLLLYPVYASNAPKFVCKWIDSLDVVNNAHAFIVSVSAGGEIIPNTACRVGAIKGLEKKGYSVVYEKMFVMPCNFGVPTKEPLAKMLLELLPKKVEEVVEEIKSGTVRRTKPFVFDRFFSQVGKVERYGAKVFGENIKVLDSCIGCGWCVDNCYVGNIVLKEGKPIFASKCQLCLACIYGCPSKALEAGILKKVVIKEGYDLKKIENTPEIDYEVDVQKLTKGYIWRGLRKYLLE